MSLPSFRFEVRFRRRNIPVADLIADLRRVARSTRNRRITTDLYAEWGKFRPGTVARRFGSWNAALEAAGLPVTHLWKVSDRMLFENLADVWRKLGRQPAGRALNKRDGVSRFAHSTYKKRFGSWHKALRAFAAFVDGRGDVDDVPRRHERRVAVRSRTDRTINWRLRATVLIRDNCLCRMCGASPAKDPTVTLHVDHIVPWSNGGATTLENLQTLCSACNIGKSNRLLWPPKANPHPCKPTRSKTSKRSSARRRR